MIAEELDVEWSSRSRRAGGAQSRVVRRPGCRRQRRHAVGRPARPARRRGRAAAADRGRGEAMERRAVDLRNRPRRRAPSADDRTLGLRMLAAAAATLPVPKEAPPLKEVRAPHDRRQADAAASTRQRSSSAADLRSRRAHPGHAVRGHRKMSRSTAAVPRRVDARAALAVPGVKRVVTIEGHKNPTWLKPGVAVVADSTWAAMKGREALRVTWDEGEGRDESSASLSAQFRALGGEAGQGARRPGRRARAPSGRGARRST